MVFRACGGILPPITIPTTSKVWRPGPCLFLITAGRGVFNQTNTGRLGIDATRALQEMRQETLQPISSPLTPFERSTEARNTESRNHVKSQPKTPKPKAILDNFRPYQRDIPVRSTASRQRQNISVSRRLAQLDTPTEN